ncbi:DUF1659 domain-containing protein [Caryophanon tenue]|uniref:DUF1659 domain-containing protein n=1 Tax=Caryophanon tenue TaxID=33978 RepID=A0A1C0Y758_9BACL|nr:DUF1659 domain-containing protein [Caryophanon tenue]OCS82973.1 hypothetical protein A6M13_06115 [Caryophanon tenue]
MATKVFEKATLRLTLDEGINEGGAVVFSTKSFTHVRENATSEQLYQFAAAFSSLSAHPLVDVQIVPQYAVQPV